MTEGIWCWKFRGIMQFWWVTGDVILPTRRRQICNGRGIVIIMCDDPLVFSADGAKTRSKNCQEERKKESHDC